jgi:hypothetical protein
MFSWNYIYQLLFNFRLQGYGADLNLVDQQTIMQVMSTASTTVGNCINISHLYHSPKCGDL